MRGRWPWGYGSVLSIIIIDKHLYQWLLEQQESSHRVSGKRLKREALRLHGENGDQSFRAVTNIDLTSFTHVVHTEAFGISCWKCDNRHTHKSLTLIALASRANQDMTSAVVLAL